MQLLKLPDGTVKVLVEGLERARIQKFTERSDFFEAEVTVMPNPPVTEKETEGLARSTAAQFESYVKLNKKVPQEVLANLSSITDFAKLPTQLPPTCGEDPRQAGAARTRDRR